VNLRSSPGLKINRNAQDAKTNYDRAIDLQREHKLDDAVACLMEAAKLTPDNPHVHLKLGQILLSQGEMIPGWREFEKVHQSRLDNFPKLPIPRWNGMRLRDQLIVLIGDQGFGDTIQFSRYVPFVAERCDQVIVACDESLMSLLKDLKGTSGVVTRWDDFIDACAAYCRLSSLPYIFGTTLDTIPANVPYLRPNPEKVEKWKTRFQSYTQSDNTRIGFVWAGRPTHQNDKRRSTRFDQWAPLFKATGASFFSIQKNIPEADSEKFQESEIVHFGDELSDFSETAALIENLDLVISVDTSIAHLAGAMGKETWVLVPWVPDWRWLYGRKDSPWYPTIRLFRQMAPDDWAGPLEEVAKQLAIFVRNRSITAMTAESS